MILVGVKLNPGSVPCFMYETLCAKSDEKFAHNFLQGNFHTVYNSSFFYVANSKESGGHPKIVRFDLFSGKVNGGTYVCTYSLVSLLHNVKSTFFSSHFITLLA